MIELREDGSSPGPDKYARLYKVVNQMTGEVGYNQWASDLPEGEPHIVKMIEAYNTFAGYASEILPIEDAKELVKKLNGGPRQKEETPHTLLVKRVRQRLADGNEGIIDGFTALADMAEMLRDIEGRRERPALPGWSR